MQIEHRFLYSLLVTTSILSLTTNCVAASLADPFAKKSIQELDLLTLQELRKEAALECVSLTTLNKMRSRDRTLDEREATARLSLLSTQQLRQIYLVARKKNGGEYPDWVKEVEQAAAGNNSDACLPKKKEDTEKQ